MYQELDNTHTSKLSKRKLTKTEINSKYIGDITKAIEIYLDLNYQKYGDFDLLYYNRFDYLQSIINFVDDNDFDGLYKNFNIELDVNKLFFKVFKQFKQQKEYDIKVEEKKGIIRQTKAMQDKINKLYEKNIKFERDTTEIWNIMILSVFIIAMVKLKNMVKYNFFSTITLIIILIITIRLIKFKFKRNK